MASPRLYKKYHRATINKDKIGLSLTDFVAYFDLADFDTEGDNIFDTCKDDGSDIRVTKADGFTILPHEINLDKTNKRGELWVRYRGIVSKDRDTDILIWYNGLGDAVPNDATTGRNAVWNEYETVLHLESTATNAVNATGIKPTVAGFKVTNASLQTGKMGNALGFSGNTTIFAQNNLNQAPVKFDSFLGQSSNELDSYTIQLVVKPEDVATVGTDHDLLFFSCWKKIGLKVMKPQAPEGGVVPSHLDLVYSHQDNKGNFHNVTAQIDPDEWHLVHLIWDGEEIKLVVQGVKEGYSLANSLSGVAGGNDVIGRDISGNSFKGDIDEFRARQRPISVDEALSEYENMFNRSTFYSVSVEVDTDVHGYGGSEAVEGESDAVAAARAASDSAVGGLNTGFPVGYDKYQVVTIDESKVAGNLTDYPIYIDLAHLDKTDSDDLFDACRDDGGDIRVTKSDGVTELPREVVSVNKTNRTGELHVKYDGTLSGSEDTEIFIWYNGVDAEPSVNDTYGRNAVWSRFARVFHFPEVLHTDSAGNDDPAIQGSTGHYSPLSLIGRYLRMIADQSTPVSNYGQPIASTATSYTVSWLFQLSHIDDDTSFYLFDNRLGLSIRARVFDNKLYFHHLLSGENGYVGASTAIVANTTYHVDMVWNGSSIVLYVNGAVAATALADSKTVGATVGSYFGTGGGPMTYLDEVRFISNDYLTTQEISTKYNNLNSPSTFYSVSGQVDINKATLKISEGLFDNTHNNFPVLVKPSVVGAIGTLTLAEAQSLRFYNNAGLTVELAREVVSADEIWVKATVSTGACIYVDWDGLRSDYGDRDTYGRNAVWGILDRCLHAENNVTDSTGNSTPTEVGTVAYADTHIGRGFSFADEFTNYPSIPDANAVDYTSALYFSCWATMIDEPSHTRHYFFAKGDAWVTNNGFNFYLDINTNTGVETFRLNKPGDNYSNIKLTDQEQLTTERSFVVFRKTATGIDLFVNGTKYTKNDGGAGDSFGTDNNPINIGKRSTSSGGIYFGTNNNYEGILDEMRFSSQTSVFTDDWVKAEYANQLHPGEFFNQVVAEVGIQAIAAELQTPYIVKHLTLTLQAAQNMAIATEDPTVIRRTTATTDPQALAVQTPTPTPQVHIDVPVDTQALTVEQHDPTPYVSQFVDVETMAMVVDQPDSSLMLSQTITPDTIELAMDVPTLAQSGSLWRLVGRPDTAWSSSGRPDTVWKIRPR